MSYEQILYERIGPVARVTLDRPDKYNAQTRQLRDELDDAFAQAVADDDVRAIILAGAGRHFSTGHDIGADGLRERGAPPTAEVRHQSSWEWNVDNALRWRELPKPTIAQVQGYCIFGGWIIAAAMDLIVASDDALFLPGYVQYFSIPWDIPVRKAKEVMFESRFMTAAEAHEAGFVNRVVPREELESATLALAESIAESDPFLVRLTKRAVNDAQDAMGFRSSVRFAHGNHMSLQYAEKLTPMEGARRLPPIDQAVRKLRRERGDQ